MRSILVIDDNPGVADALRLLFTLHDIRTLAAADPARGLDLLQTEEVDLVIADMNFSADTTSGEDGVALFRQIREHHADLPVILLTAWTSLESAVQLIKAGAADYVAKPWDDAKLIATVENLLELSDSARERGRQRRERRKRREQLAAKYDLRGIVFASDAMERAVEMACQVARADVPVLITGPNGAGKERIAEILHANSAVSGGPFVALNCGAVPADLIEAELFGADAGAYTGANRAREGRFELADGGTLFLDEVGNLPLAGQVKLLRVLETGEFQRLGSSRTRSSRVRVLSATNADLPALIQGGLFREDLYYRLNVIEIGLPALAERPEDIAVLAEHFLGPGVQLADDALAALHAHAWPGNVRELRNAMERARLMARDAVIRAADLGLPPPVRRSREPDELAPQAIEAALRAAGGNVSRAAQALGLSRQALYRRIERYGLRV
ncbi:MAG TPA: sigma-54 dependent transcriptional regulator [Steroidobacteraceae bacterium]|nr:sigma-54 dependent transcriptional regulator [Steroidobacteraceae bacterium]